MHQQLDNIEEIDRLPNTDNLLKLNQEEKNSEQTYDK
jgi:hypothetical protein